MAFDPVERARKTLARIPEPHRALAASMVGAQSSKESKLVAVEWLRYCLDQTEDESWPEKIEAWAGRGQGYEGWKPFAREFDRIFSRGVDLGAEIEKGRHPSPPLSSEELRPGENELRPGSVMDAWMDSHD